MAIAGLRRGIPYAGRPPGPFSPAPRARALRLVIEPKVPGQVARSFANMTGDDADCLEYLWSLRFSEHVDVWWLARYDLPPGPGMIYVEPMEPGAEDGVATLLRENGSTSVSVVGLRYWMDIASDIGVGRSDLVLASAAEALQADIVVTKRKTLLEADLGDLQGSNPMNPKTAVALVALHLRLRDALPIRMDKVYTVTATGRTVARRALWGLMPSLPSWRAGLGYLSGITGLRVHSMLGEAFSERLIRALGHRDQIHQILLRDEHSGALAQALAEHFDHMMLNLMAALDVSARVAHVVCGLDPSLRYSASWADSRWLRRINQQNPQLAGVLKPKNGTNASIVMLISRLRNSVHGEMLSPVVVRGRQSGLILTLPDQDGRDLFDLLARSFDVAEWGLTAEDDEVLLDPGVFTERLFPAVFEILEQLVNGSCLRGVQLSPYALDDSRLNPQWARTLMGLV